MAVFKILDLVGSSKVSWQDAVEEAVRQASKTVKNIVAVESLTIPQK
jgi:flavin-binding protein dodecin